MTKKRKPRAKDKTRSGKLADQDTFSLEADSLSLGYTDNVFRSAEDMLGFARRITQQGEAFGVTAVLLPGSDNVVTTDRFPEFVLTAYLKFQRAGSFNSTDLVKASRHDSKKDTQRLLQGWYGSDVPYGIDQCEQALRAHPKSKRAVITIARRYPHNHFAGAWKPLRELVFVLRNNSLNCQAFYRAQDVEELPKEIYVNTEIQKELAERLGVGVGYYAHTSALLFNEINDEQMA